MNEDKTTPLSDDGRPEMVWESGESLDETVGGSAEGAEPPQATSASATPGPPLRASRKPIDLGHTYPMPPWLMLFRWLISALVWTMIANAFALVGTVVLLIPLVEADVMSLPWELLAALDGFGRRFVGFAVLGGLFGLAVIFAVLNDAYLALLRWQLGRFTSNPENSRRVPVDWQRRSYFSGTTTNRTHQRASERLFTRYPGLVILSVFAIVLGSVVVLTAIVSIASGERGFALVAGGVGLLLPLGAFITMKFLFARPVPKAEEFWGTRLPGHFESVGGAPGSSPTLERKLVLRRRLRMASSVLVSLAGVSFLLTAIAVVVTQPCRLCDPRELTELGEGFVDAVSGAGGRLLALTVIPLVLVLLAEALLGYEIRRTLVREVSDPSAKRPPWPVLQSTLAQDAPLIRVFTIVHVTGVLIIEVGITGLMLNNPVLLERDTWLTLIRFGAGLLAVGVFTWWFGRDKAAREKEQLMERWG